MLFLVGKRIHSLKIMIGMLTITIKKSIFIKIKQPSIMKKLLFLILLFLFPFTNSFACSCSELEEPLSKKVERSYTNSKLIITGKVIDINTEYTDGTKYYKNPVIYKFEILKVFKGNSEKEIIEILSESTGSMCGYKFELGESYLVYATTTDFYSSVTNKEFDFDTNLCSRNQVLKNVEKEEMDNLQKINIIEASKNTFTEISPEIDIMRQMIKDYEGGDWKSYKSHYTEDAKIYHNRVNSNPRSVDEAIEEHKSFIGQVSEYKYSTSENQTVEMIIDSKGTTWVSFWGVWTGTFAESGNETEIIVHLTSKFEDGKIVQEHMYWDTAPFVLQKIWVDNNTHFKTKE
jgi:ketosteroid isomerase-like protein